MRQQQAFTLVELLVALAVMAILVAVRIVSVGILGVAGLQLLSLQNNTSAMSRTQAFHAAYDIIDRARTNPGEDYSITMADDPPAAQDCSTNDCSNSQMREYDQATWLAGLAATLPSGDGEVDVSGGTSTVTVRWRDNRDPSAAPLDVSVSTAM